MEQEWISLNQFMKNNKIGYEAAKKLISSGQIEYQKIGKQYKIKISKSEAINESMEKIIRRNEELETYLKTIQNMINKINV